MDPSISVEPASTTTLHELEPIQSTEEEKLNTLIISLTPDGNRITYECTIDETIKSLKGRMSNDQGEGKLRL